MIGVPVVPIAFGAVTPNARLATFGIAQPDHLALGVREGPSGIHRLKISNRLMKRLEQCLHAKTERVGPVGAVARALLVADKDGVALVFGSIPVLEPSQLEGLEPGSQLGDAIDD